MRGVDGHDLGGAEIFRAEHLAPNRCRVGEMNMLRTHSEHQRRARTVLADLGHGDGRVVERTARGDGPVDAAFKSIEAATGVEVVLRKFEVHAVTEGEDAQGEARVYVEYNHKSYRGASVSTNIVEAGARAFLEVINRIELAHAGARSQRERAVAPA